GAVRVIGQIVAPCLGRVGARGPGMGAPLARQRRVGFGLGQRPQRGARRVGVPPLGVALQIGAVVGGPALGAGRRPVAVILGLGDALLPFLALPLLGQRLLALLLQEIEIRAAEI